MSWFPNDDGTRNAVRVCDGRTSLYIRSITTNENKTYPYPVDLKKKSVISTGPARQ